MKQKVLSIMCVVTLIITLTMTYFVYAGANIASYASDNVSTNNKNVEFGAYFKSESNEKTVNKQITSDNLETSLFLYFNIKNEGSLDSTVKLENANFKFKTSESKYVKEIQDDYIKIDQIDSGTEIEIEVKVEFMRNQVVTYDFLNKESEVILNANYTNEKSNTFNVKSSKNVSLALVHNITSNDIETDAKIITNKVLEVNGEEKRVIQFSIKSGIIQNKYPIKNVTLGIIVPEIDNNKPEINYNSRFNDISNTDYEYTNGIAKITMYNEDGKWSTKGNEETILTYLYPANISVEDFQVKIVQMVTLLDNTLINSNQTELNVNGEIDGIVTIKEKNNEDSIYKGKLNNGIEREYKTTTTLQFNLINVAQNIMIEENEAKYECNNQEIDANTYFVQASIKKSEIYDTLGENGKVIILDENNNIISTIDSSTDTDENGIVTINFNDVKKIKILTTEPKEFGEINIENKKIIRQSDKNIVKMASKIITESTVKYNDMSDIKQKVKNEILLKETKTEGIISINKQQLSTLNTNNVDINVILKSTKEENDLYKNPKIEIILPNEIQDIKVNSINKLYADEFEVSKAIIETKEGVGRIITIELQGEQTSYLSEPSEGIQIIINADISFNKTTPSQQTDLIMKYSNENGIDRDYQTDIKINLMSKYGLFVYSKISGFEGNNIIEKTTDEMTEINLEEEKVITIERNIINNFNVDLYNVKLEGEIPEIGEFVEISTNVEGSQVSYLNNTQYKIEIPEEKIVPGQLITVICRIKVKPNTQEQNNLEKLKINCTYYGENINEEYSINFKNSSISNLNSSSSQLLKQNNVNGIGDLEILAVSGGKELAEGADINAGQTVKVKLVLKNTTGETLNNVKISVKQENATLYNYKRSQEQDTSGSGQMTVTFYEEDETIEQKEFAIGKIESGNSATLEYEYSVAEESGKETKGTIIINADNKEEQTISALNNNIVDADLKVNVKYSENLERPITAGGVFSITIGLKNISDKDLENINVKIPLQDEIKKIEESYISDENFTLLKIENKTAIFNLKSLKAGESKNEIITFKVNDFEEKEIDVKFLISANVNNREYISNEMLNKGYNLSVDISATQKGSIETEGVKLGDKIIYNTTIKNNESETKNIEIVDSVQKDLEIEKAYIIRNGEQEDITINKNMNLVDYDTQVNANSEINFIIETKIINYENASNNKEITNIVGINAFSDYIESNPVTYKLTESNSTDNNQKEDNTDNNDNGSNNNNNSQNQNNINNSDNNSKEKNTANKISGIVWLDKNKNGERNTNEKNLNNIEVILIDANTGETISSTYTDGNGYYEFLQINNGRYIVEIKYDNQQFSVTEYKKSGISENKNSDIIQKQINGENVGLTDVIEINNNSISNIDAGLIENEIFNLSLNKYITRVILQNNQGTRVLQYNKEKLTKLEIPARQLAGSIVLVEYNIEVKNEGEIPGYASEIIDYIPEDLKFSSEINKNWYLSTDKQLHNISLANEIINPGESKVISLTLTKTMTENNTGISVNKAEIAKTSNNLAIENINKGDNNEAKILVSIKTGNLKIAISTITISLIILIIVAFQLKRKKGDKNE